ncbi:MAG: outer membrane beta-barrel protein [bacterium]
MTRKTLVACFAALALPIAAAQAQLGFGVAAGPSTPMGDFSDIAKTGYQASGLVNLSLPLLPVGLRFEGSFGEYDYKDIGTVKSDAKARILSATANAMLSTPGIIGPYLIGGVGYYRASSECSTCSTSSSKVGFNAGVGVKLGLAGLSVFAEARYHYVPGASNPTTAGKNSSTQFVPVSVGITF